MNPHASSFTPGGASNVGALYSPYAHQASYPDDSDSMLDGPVQQNAEGYFEVSNFCEPNVPLEGISSVAFDPYEELLWTGTASGRLVSYTSPAMSKYTAWRPSYEPIRKILPSESGVVALSATDVKCYTKGGLTLSSFTPENVDLQSMMFTNPRQTELLVGGLSETMYIFDLKRGKVQKEIPVPSGVTAMGKTSRLYCVGHTDGKVTLRDPRSHRTEHSFVAHLSGVADLDIKSDLLVTCGYSNRMGQVIVDPLVKVFDIRTMRVLLPVSVPVGAAFVRFHPKFSSTFLVATQMGQFELCDAQSCVTGMQRSMVDTRGQLLISSELSASGEAIVFGDTLGYVHLWADREDFRVNLHSKGSLEFPDARPPPPAMQITENSSLTVPSTATFPSQLQVHNRQPGIPAAAGKRAAMLSDWSGHMYFAVSRPPEPIDPGLLKNLRQVDFVGVIPHTPGTSLRNQVRRPIPPQIDEAGHVTDVALFSSTELQDEHFPASPDKKSRPRTRAPRNYRRIPIRATKLGFEDFDFSPYNKTCFSGLENILPNSYINPIIHLLYYIPQLRVHVLNHLCESEYCLLGELAFLFHMMDSARGRTSCQAKNLLRTLHEIPQATRLGLLEEDSSIPVPRMTERFTSFVLSHLNRESQSHEHVLKPEERKHIDADLIDKLFGMSLQISNTCSTCNSRTSLENRVHHLKLSLPDAQQSSAHSFASVLKQTLSSESNTQTWCENCKTFQSCDQAKDVVDLPNVLVLTTPQTEPQAQAFWTAISDDYNPNSVNENLSQWIPFVVKPQRDSKTNKWSVQEFSDTTLQSDPNNVYDLVGIVAAISDTSEPRGHAVSLVRVSTWCHKKVGDEGGIGNSWYLFNDFHILPISKYEAVHIDADWKVPCVLVYARRQLDERIPIPTFVNPITEDVILNDKSKNNATPDTFSPLTKETLPKSGDELAIDAEFVRIREEEVVEKPDGSRFVVRPGDFSLARVSVLRCQPEGKPEDDGKCVIDDYIATRDSTILDYLTQYSGIVPGDLDPSSSTHHVTSLKSAYLKLRWLVDSGCKFIGHGLRKDFRIINLFVPPEQVIDTVELYYIDRQRKISLKFLTSHLLDLDIQLDTHDSIEDARSALMLYRKYQEMQKNGTFQDELDQIYEQGRSLQWKSKSATSK